MSKWKEKKKKTIRRRVPALENKLDAQSAVISQWFRKRLDVSTDHRRIISVVSSAAYQICRCYIKKNVQYNICPTRCIFVERHDNRTDAGGVYRISAPVLRVSKFISNRYHKAYFYIACRFAVFRLFYSRLDEAKRGEEVSRARANTDIQRWCDTLFSLGGGSFRLGRTSRGSCVGDIKYKWWMRRVAIYPRDLHYYFWDISNNSRTMRRNRRIQVGG